MVILWPWFGVSATTIKELTVVEMLWWVALVFVAAIAICVLLISGPLVGVVAIVIKSESTVLGVRLVWWWWMIFLPKANVGLGTDRVVFSVVIIKVDACSLTVCIYEVQTTATSGLKNTTSRGEIVHESTIPMGPYEAGILE